MEELKVDENPCFSCTVSYKNVEVEKFESIAKLWDSRAGQCSRRSYYFKWEKLLCRIIFCILDIAMENRGTDPLQSQIIRLLKNSKTTLDHSLVKAVIRTWRKTWFLLQWSRETKKGRGWRAVKEIKAEVMSRMQNSISDREGLSEGTDRGSWNVKRISRTSKWEVDKIVSMWWLKNGNRFLNGTDLSDVVHYLVKWNRSLHKRFYLSSTKRKKVSLETNSTKIASQRWRI